MIYAENVFICMVIPLGIAALFLKKGARSFCVALITGMVVCLLSAYVSGFFADYYSYDTRSAALFITIVTNPRRRLFGKIVDAKLQKTQLGFAVERRISELGLMPGIRLFNSVVMPDHVHLQLHLRAGLSEPLVALGRAIGAFKSLCAKDFHELTGESGSLWQQGYHDWICQSAEMIAAGRVSSMRSTIRATRSFCASSSSSSPQS